MNFFTTLNHKIKDDKLYYIYQDHKDNELKRQAIEKMI